VQRLGVDIGGTFTDFVLYKDGRIYTHKVLSTPADPAVGFLKGLSELVGDDMGGLSIVHGSTVATNALLERKGATTGLITTAGFEDVLEIGRQNRPALYDISVDRPPPLVDRPCRIGVRERITPDGKELIPLDEEGVKMAVSDLRKKGVRSVAVCFLFSYANDSHERIVSDIVEASGMSVSPSCEILPEYREYERCSTTVVNAYVSPLVSDYLNYLSEGLRGVSLQIMQSNGGLISAAAASRAAVRTVLSGPAGGVAGAVYMAGLAGYSKAITFDMGGTSTDVSLSVGGVRITTESKIGGCPIGVPVVDVHSVGAGGGSIAYLDPAGALRVGPRSAGAEPGPVCYRRGGREITVTDVNLILGRLHAERFLGGGMALDYDGALERFKELSAKVGLGLADLAWGIVSVVNSNMEKAIRVISVERGYDPREFVLLSFGGAGGLHACDLARSLSIPKVIVPPNAGVLSALGMVVGDVVKDYSLTVLIPSTGASLSLIEELFTPLLLKGYAEMSGEGIGKDRMKAFKYLDMRYVGQSYELSIPLSDDFVGAFHTAHRERYGYSREHAGTEVVTIRLKLVGEQDKPELPRYEAGDGDGSLAMMGEKEAYFEGRSLMARLYRRDMLKTGDKFRGPGIVIEPYTTTVVPPDYTAEVDGYGNLLINL
jgi:N-methylhydantoinase A